MKGQAWICDVCGKQAVVERRGEQARPKGWEQLRLPRTVKLARKGKNGRTHAIKIGRLDCCEYCVNAVHALVEKRHEGKS